MTPAWPQLSKGLCAADCHLFWLINHNSGLNLPALACLVRPCINTLFHCVVFPCSVFLCSVLKRTNMFSFDVPGQDHMCHAQARTVLGSNQWEWSLRKTQVHCMWGSSQGHKWTRKKGTLTPSDTYRPQLNTNWLLLTCTATYWRLLIPTDFFLLTSTGYIWYLLTYTAT